MTSYSLSLPSPHTNGRSSCLTVTTWDIPFTFLSLVNKFRAMSLLCLDNILSLMGVEVLTETVIAREIFISGFDLFSACSAGSNVFLSTKFSCSLSCLVVLVGVSMVMTHSLLCWSQPRLPAILLTGLSEHSLSGLSWRKLSSWLVMSVWESKGEMEIYLLDMPMSIPLSWHVHQGWRVEEDLANLTSPVFIIIFSVIKSC